MFEHVTVSASELDASEHFCTTVLDAIGLPGPGRADFRLASASGPDAVTRGLHIAFVTSSRQAVDAFWHAGVRAGYESDGEPAPRALYSDTYYGGFLLDPDGNSAEAVHHGRERQPPNSIDPDGNRVLAVAAR